MTYTLNGITLKVLSEDVSKRAGLMKFPMPLSDSSDTYIYDLEGATREITLRCYYNGTLSEIQSYVSSIQSLVNGSQLGYTYESDLLGSLTVFVEDVRINFGNPAQKYVEFTIKLVEGVG